MYSMQFLGSLHWNQCTKFSLHPGVMSSLSRYQKNYENSFREFSCDVIAAMLERKNNTFFLPG